MRRPVENLDCTVRRLPIYLVLDCSGSMRGQPIEAVKHGISQLLADLRSDPQALETVWLSVITFDSDAQQLEPLTEIHEFREPPLKAGGSTALGKALKLLADCFEREVRKTTAEQKGDWRPLVFLMTDGRPADAWKRAADDLKTRHANIIACGAGAATHEANLKRITDIVVRLDDLAPGTIAQFFKWVSASIATASRSVGTSGEAPFGLPPPPPVLQIVP